MSTSNGGSEPVTPVNPDVAAANQTPAAQTPVPPIAAPAEPPRVLTAAELAQENVPEAPTAPQAPAAPQTPAIDIHKERFNFQAKTNLLKVQQAVEKSVADGRDMEEAFQEVIQGVPEHLRNHITKLYNGEIVEGGKKPVDPADIANSAVDRQFALRDAQEKLTKAFAENNLNVATAEALSARQSVNADYQRLLKSNSPQEAAKYALFNAGIANKQATDQAFESGQQFANQGAPAPGFAGTPPAGTLQQGQELTEKQIADSSLEQIMDHDAKIAQTFNNSSPMQVPVPQQGNPNVA